jgi:hypothetical protein
MHAAANPTCGKYCRRAGDTDRLSSCGKKKGRDEGERRLRPWLPGGGRLDRKVDGPESAIEIDRNNISLRH